MKWWRQSDEQEDTRCFFWLGQQIVAPISQRRFWNGVVEVLKKTKTKKRFGDALLDRTLG